MRRKQRDAADLSAFRRFNQPFNFAPGEGLPVAVPPARVSAFAPVHRFVESLACGMPLKPLSGGRGRFALSTKGFILSRDTWNGRQKLCRAAARLTPEKGTAGKTVGKLRNIECATVHQEEGEMLGIRWVAHGKDKKKRTWHSHE